MANEYAAIDPNKEKALLAHSDTTNAAETRRVVAVDGGILSYDFLINVSRGNVPGYSLIHKFGSGPISTTLVPIAPDLHYETPTTAVALEIVSSDAADAQNGAGARQITVVGLNASWEEVTQVVSTHATDGTIAVSIPTSLIRLYRWYVSSSGTYATIAAGSHVGTLTIRVAGGGATWSTIGISPFPIGQSEIGCFTVPLGKTAYLLSKNIFVEGTKPADVYFFQRTNANDITTPYSGAMRLVDHEVGIDGPISLQSVSPKGPFVGPCDLGFMAKVATTAAVVSVEFELLLIDN